VTDEVAPAVVTFPAVTPDIRGLWAFDAEWVPDVAS
jgi:hypothetical protein